MVRALTMRVWRDLAIGNQHPPSGFTQAIWYSSSRMIINA
jgi:hypothetical protein